MAFPMLCDCGARHTEEIRPLMKMDADAHAIEVQLASCIAHIVGENGRYYFLRDTENLNPSRVYLLFNERYMALVTFRKDSEGHSDMPVPCPF